MVIILNDKAVFKQTKISKNFNVRRTIKNLFKFYLKQMIFWFHYYYLDYSSQDHNTLFYQNTLMKSKILQYFVNTLYVIHKHLRFRVFNKHKYIHRQFHCRVLGMMMQSPCKQ